MSSHEPPGRGRVRARRLLLPCALILCLGLAGCLGPQVDDTVVTSDLILAPGTEPPSAYDDPAMSERIAANDGVQGTIPLIHGFAEGAPVAYWDFGPAPSVSAPLFFLVEPDTGDPIGHPGIVSTMPGDPGYSPYWSMFAVPITNEYVGQVIPSVAALEAAQELGLVGAPEATGHYVNCPAVGPDVLLELPGGDTLAPQGRGFIDGHSVPWYNLNALLGDDMREHESDGVTVPVADLYQLRREGGEPLAEYLRQVDMTGDGDIRDSNDILALGGAVERRTVVTVVVPADYISIDTTGAQDMAGFQAATDLFQTGDGERSPVIGNVVAFEVTEESRNIVVVPPGAL